MDRTDPETKEFVTVRVRAIRKLVDNSTKGVTEYFKTHPSALSAKVETHFQSLSLYAAQTEGFLQRILDHPEETHLESVNRSGIFRLAPQAPTESHAFQRIRDLEEAVRRLTEFCQQLGYQEDDQ